METFVLIRSNFRDESDHVPLTTSDNQDWLIDLIPDDFRRINDGTTATKIIPTFVHERSGEYYEIRTVEKLIKKPYKGINTLGMTKKRFKELADIHQYGRGINKRFALYFDWCNDHDIGIGYKYMIKGYRCTKAKILADAYDILIKTELSELCWYDYKEAKTNKERFKVPISG